MFPSSKEVRAFFFEAMMSGYAGKARPVDVIRMPGFKEIQYHKDSWHCIDRWGIRPDSNHSAGVTTIWHNDVPIWTMNYQGWYSDKVIDFLKLALGTNYRRGIFYGGRGPHRFNHPEEPLVYINNRRPGFGDQSFDHFGGHEIIQDSRDCTPFGYHDYMGMSLINLAT